MQCIRPQNISLLYKNKVTEPFYTTAGLKQGDILSIIFFNIFINDLLSLLADTSNGNNEKPKLDDTNITSLLCSLLQQFFHFHKKNYRTKLLF